MRGLKPRLHISLFPFGEPVTDFVLVASPFLKVSPQVSENLAKFIVLQIAVVLEDVSVKLHVYFLVLLFGLASVPGSLFSRSVLRSVPVIVNMRSHALRCKPAAFLFYHVFVILG